MKSPLMKANLVGGPGWVETTNKGRFRRALAVEIHLKTVVIATAMGMSDWTILLSLERLADLSADAQVDTAYKILHVRLDPRGIPEGKLDLWILHELTHALIWPFEVWRASHGPAVDPTDKSYGAYVDAEEQSCALVTKTLLTLMQRAGVLS